MNEFKFHDIQQNSEEWFQLRAGKLTSSNLKVVMAHYGKKFAEPAQSYASKIALEQITGLPLLDGFTNYHTDRGNEQEPIARELYEATTFQDTSNGGFFESAFIGCSPDFLVGDNGLGEIKSVIANIHYKNVERQNIPPAHKWQIIGNLKFTSRDWIDSISYCADYPIGKQLFIHRVYKEEFEEEFKQIDDRISQFKLLVEQSKYLMLNSKYSNIASNINF